MNVATIWWLITRVSGPHIFHFVPDFSLKWCQSASLELWGFVFCCWVKEIINYKFWYRGSKVMRRKWFIYFHYFWVNHWIIKYLTLLWWQVRRLEAQGIPSKQAEAITAAITEVLNDSLEIVAHAFVSKSESQKVRLFTCSIISSCSVIWSIVILVFVRCYL